MNSIRNYFVKKDDFISNNHDEKEVTLNNVEPYFPVLKQLKEITRSKEFVYLTKSEIEETDSICLTPCDQEDYEGIVASKENSRWILYICPGGGDGEFSEDDFSKLMPIAIQEMYNKNIKPSAFVIDGCHPGNTLDNFLKWQTKIN